MSLSFVFIGAGNLATHLAAEIHGKVGEVVQVYSRTLNSAAQLASLLNTSFTNDVEQIDKQADVYFVALTDSAVAEILSQIDLGDKLLIHCSGSLPIDVLTPFSQNTGVLYPLQTFSKNRMLNFQKIPVFIEANSAANLDILFRIAEKISEKVTVLDSEKRRSLHLSAVIASNFVNQMYTLASDYLAANNLSFNVLHPLIEETAHKAIEMGPENSQTGPAVRFDKATIEKHLTLLHEYPDLKELYNSISKSIFDRHQKK